MLSPRKNCYFCSGVAVKSSKKCRQHLSLGAGLQKQELFKPAAKAEADDANTGDDAASNAGGGGYAGESGAALQPDIPSGTLS